MTSYHRPVGAWKAPEAWALWAISLGPLGPGRALWAISEAPKALSKGPKGLEIGLFGAENPDLTGIWPKITGKSRK